MRVTLKCFTYNIRSYTIIKLTFSFTDLALRCMNGRSTGYNNRGHSPAKESVKHLIDNKNFRAASSQRVRKVRRITQLSPCWLTRHFKVWPPDASAKKNGSEAEKTGFSIFLSKESSTLTTTWNNLVQTPAFETGVMRVCVGE